MDKFFVRARILYFLRKKQFRSGSKLELFLQDMTYQLITTHSAFYEQVLALRQMVLRAPLGMNLMDEDLRDEVNQFIAVALNDDRVVACLMAKAMPNACWKLRQMAVMPALQKNGIGKGLISFMEAEARNQGIRSIELHARETAVDFYSNSGYSITGGLFLEVGIPHLKMHKSLHATV